MKPGVLSAREELVPDERLWRVIDQLRARFGSKVDDMEFVTFVQPQTTKRMEDRNGLIVPVPIPEMAVFAIIEDNPRPYAKKVGAKVMTTGTAALQDWQQAEAERAHYVGGKDALYEIFVNVLKRHLVTMQNLREMI